MNLNELRKLITDDLSNGDCPLLVIAECGVHSTGHVDNLEELSDLCNTYGIWLHLKGNALAALSLPLNFNREVISNFRVCTHTLKVMFPENVYFQISNSYECVQYLLFWF